MLLSLASFRLTRLVTTDDAAAPFRRWVSRLTDREHAAWVAQFASLEAHENIFDAWWFRRDALRTGVPERDWPEVPGPRWRWLLGALLRCNWCAGLWISGGVAAAYTWRVDGSWWLAAVLACALSSVVGILTMHLDRIGG